jgi:HlyD family secretion protein
MVLGETNPLHVRIDIDENEIERVDRRGAIVSPRGNAGRACGRASCAPSRW